MRFGTANYFLGIVKLTGTFQTSYMKEKKSRVIFCETRIGIAPTNQKSQKRQPLPRLIIYFLGSLGNKAENYYKKGDYVLVQGRLKLISHSQKSNTPQVNLFLTNEYHLNVLKMSLVKRS